MNHEVVNQIVKSVETLLNSKHGPFYAGLVAVTSLTIGYMLIDNKYCVSAGRCTFKPRLEEEKIRGEEE